MRFSRMFALQLKGKSMKAIPSTLTSAYLHSGLDMASKRDQVGNAFGPCWADVEMQMGVNRICVFQLFHAVSHFCFFWCIYIFIYICIYISKVGNRVKRGRVGGREGIGGG